MVQLNKIEVCKQISKLKHKLPIKLLTEEAFATPVKKRVNRISQEFTDGFDFMEDMERTVTIFGFARFKPGNPHYKKARELGKRLTEYGIWSADSITKRDASGTRKAGFRVLPSGAPK